jgi:hypothetical protein
MENEEADELLKHAQNLAKISQAFHDLTQGISYEDRTAMLVSLMMQNTISTSHNYIAAVAELGNIFASMIFTLKQVAELDDGDDDEDDEDKDKEETRN